MTKLRSLEMLRAIAALLVVMFHTHTIFGTQTGIVPFFGVFGDASHGVDLFFVLSGFIMVHVHAGDWGRPTRLGNYVFSRVTRIYPTVWIVSAAAIAVYAAGFGGADKATKLAPWNIVSSVLLLPERGDPQQGNALVNVTWTLTYEVFFYLAFALLLLNRRLGAAVLAIWQAAILAVLVLGIDRHTVPGGYYLRSTCLEFAIGIGCALLVRHRRAVPVLAAAAAQWLILTAGTALFVGGLLFGAFRPDGAPDLPDFLVFGTGAGLAILALTLLELSGRLSVPDVLVRLGGASYALYLVHFSVISLVARATIRAGVVPMNDAVFLAAAAIGVAAGIGFHRCVDQPLQRLLRRARLAALPSNRVEPAHIL